MSLFAYDWLWVGMGLYFGVVEGIALWHNHLSKQDWTLTAFIKTLIPLSIRVALLAWLAFHFTH